MTEREIERRAGYAFSDLNLAEPVADQPSQRWLQLVPIGSWEHSDYGQLDITPERIARMAANYAAGLPGIDLPVDIEHNWGEAVGWIQNVEARADGLWGLVDFNIKGQQLLADRAYRYISPEWFPDWKDSRDGKHYEDVVTSIALTNRPWFKDLPAIVNSESERGRTYLVPAYRFRWEKKGTEIWYRVRDPGDFDPDTFRSLDMPGVKGIRMVMGRLKPENAPKGHDPKSLVIQALRFDLDEWTMDKAKAWVAKHKDRLKASAPADEISRAIRAADRGDNPMPEVPNPDVKPDPAPKPDPGASSITMTEFNAVKAEAAASKAAAEAANKAAADANARLDRAQLHERIAGLRFGENKQRVLAPAMVEQLTDTALRFAAGDEREKFLTGIAGLSFVELGERGDGGHEPTGDAIQRFSEAVAAKIKADPKLQYADAMRLVAAENPQLDAERARAIRGQQPVVRSAAK